MINMTTTINSIATTASPINNTNTTHIINANPSITSTNNNNNNTI